MRAVECVAALYTVLIVNQHKDRMCVCVCDPERGEGMHDNSHHRDVRGRNEHQWLSLKHQMLHEKQEIQPETCCTR